MRPSLSSTTRCTLTSPAPTHPIQPHTRKTCNPLQIPTPNAPEFVSYYLLYLGATFGNFKKKPDELTKVLRSSGPEVQVSMLQYVIIR